jgi:hypothetical protein
VCGAGGPGPERGESDALKITEREREKAAVLCALNVFAAPFTFDPHPTFCFGLFFFFIFFYSVDAMNSKLKRSP